MRKHPIELKGRRIVKEKRKNFLLFVFSSVSFGSLRELISNCKLLPLSPKSVTEIFKLSLAVGKTDEREMNVD
jgi:hypothetical protein